MIEYIVIIFPLILAFIIVKLMRYTLDMLSGIDGGKCFNEIKIRSLINIKNRALIFVSFIVFGIPVTFLQYSLIRTVSDLNSNIYFSNYAWDNFLLSVIHGIFLSILCASIIGVWSAYKKYSRGKVRQRLMVIRNESRDYKSLTSYTYSALGVGVMLTIVNIVASNIFVRVENDRIYFNHFLSFNEQSIEYDTIDCIVRFSRRIAPNSVNKFNPYIELYLTNGKTLDTFYLIERDDHSAFVNAIEIAAKRDIPVIKIKTVKSSKTGSPCDEARKFNKLSVQDQAISLINQYENELKIDPDNANLYYKKARALINMNKYREARLELDKAINLDPNKIDYYLLMDFILVRQREWDQIINYWDRFIALNPENSRAYLERSGTYYHKGDLKLAVKNAKKAAELGSSKGKAIYEKYKHLVE